MLNVITDNLNSWISAEIKKTSVGRASDVKLELYGIKKLRELVLGMALKGLFQHENESLPENINQAINEAKERYYKGIEKKPKQYNFGPALLNEFSLPSGWTWKRIGDLCDLQTGATPSRQKSEYFGGEIRWLVSGDINKGIIDDCEGRITQEGLKNSNCKVLPKNTVLIALNGQGKTRATVALLKVPAACNQSLVGIIPYDELIIDPVFLLYALRYRYYEIRDITGQKQRRGLNMGLVSELSVPLPPLSEQLHIVAKVDELMALCDQLEQEETDNKAVHQTLVKTLLSTLTRVETPEEFIQNWQRICGDFYLLFTTEESIEQLKQTILQLAIMGKLVPQDPNDEPINDLLMKIEEEKSRLIKEKKIKKQKILPKIDDEEKPFQLPKNWQWVRLGDVTTYGISNKMEPNSANENTWVLELEDIEKTTSKLLQKVRFEQREFRSTKNVFEINDVIYGKLRPYLDKVIVADEAGVCSTEMIPLHGYKYILPHYLKLVMKSPYFIDYANNSTHGMNLPRMGTDKARLALFPMVPENEQYRIIEKVDELMTLCDSLKAIITETKNTQILLANAIVEKAI